MISRQSHIPVVAAQIASTRPISGSSRRPIGGQGLQADRFAQGIAGKYGFGGSSRFGRLELIFRTLKEMEAAPVHNRGAAPIYHQWFLHVQIVLQQMKEAQRGWVRRERELTHRWEQWLRYAESAKLGPVRNSPEAGHLGNGQAYTTLLRMAWTMFGDSPSSSNTAPQEGIGFPMGIGSNQASTAAEVIRLASQASWLPSLRLQQGTEVQHNRLDPAAQGNFSGLEQGMIQPWLTSYQLDSNPLHSLLALQGGRSGIHTGFPEQSFIARWLNRQSWRGPAKPEIIMQRIAGQTGRFRSRNEADTVRQGDRPVTTHIYFENDQGWADHWRQAPAGSFPPWEERFTAFAQGYPASILFTYNPYFTWIRSNNVFYGENLKNQGDIPPTGTSGIRFSGRGHRTRTALGGFSLPTLQRFRINMQGHFPGNWIEPSPSSLHQWLWPSIGLFYPAVRISPSQDNYAAVIQRTANLALQRSWDTERAGWERDWLQLLIKGHAVGDGRPGEQKEGTLTLTRNQLSFIREQERRQRLEPRQQVAGAGENGFERAVPQGGISLQRRLLESMPGAWTWGLGLWPELLDHAGRAGGRSAIESTVLMPIHLEASLWGSRRESGTGIAGPFHRMEDKLRLEAVLNLRARPLAAAWGALYEFLGSKENARIRYLFQDEISDRTAASGGQAFSAPYRSAASLLWRMPAYSWKIERFIEGAMNRPATNDSQVYPAGLGISGSVLQRTLEALAAARLGAGRFEASTAPMPVQWAAERSPAAMWRSTQASKQISPETAYTGAPFISERPSYHEWNAPYFLQSPPAWGPVANGKYLGSPFVPMEEHMLTLPPIWQWGGRIGQDWTVSGGGPDAPATGIGLRNGWRPLQEAVLTRQQRSPGKEALRMYLTELQAAAAAAKGLTITKRLSSAQPERGGRISFPEWLNSDRSHGSAKERMAFMQHVLNLNRLTFRVSRLSSTRRTDEGRDERSSFEQPGSRAWREAEARKAQANANLSSVLRSMQLEMRLDQPLIASLPGERGRLLMLRLVGGAPEALTPTATAGTGMRRMRGEDAEANRSGQTGRLRPGVDYGGLTGSSPQTVQLHRQRSRMRYGLDTPALTAIADNITRLSRSIGLLPLRLLDADPAASSAGRGSDADESRRLAEGKSLLLPEVFRERVGLNIPGAMKDRGHRGTGTEWFPLSLDSSNSLTHLSAHAAERSRDLGYVWNTWRDRILRNHSNPGYAGGPWNRGDTVWSTRQDSGFGRDVLKVQAMRMANSLMNFRQLPFQFQWGRHPIQPSRQLEQLTDGPFQLRVAGGASMDPIIRVVRLANQAAMNLNRRMNGLSSSRLIPASGDGRAFAILRELLIPLRQAGLAASTTTTGWPTPLHSFALQYLQLRASQGVSSEGVQKAIAGLKHFADSSAFTDRQLPASAAWSAYDSAVRSSLVLAANWLSSAMEQAAADSQLPSRTKPAFRFPLAQQPKGAGSWSDSLQRAAFIFRGQSLSAAGERLGALRKVIQDAGIGPVQEANRLRQAPSPASGAAVQRFIVWLQHAARQPIGAAVMGIDSGSNRRQGTLPGIEEQHILASGVNTVFVHMMLKRMQPEAQWSGAPNGLAGSGLEHRADSPDAFEHKRTSSVTPEESEWTQAPLDISWLKPSSAQAPAAAAAPAVQPAPQIELSQLEELIKELPQLDIRKIADKVYQEIEKKMRFERQRRGL